MSSPSFIPPSFPKPTRALPVGDAWWHEPKLDGFRIQVVKERRSVRLFNRRGANWSARLPSLTEGLAELPVRSIILDGELVFLNERDAVDFAGLLSKRGAMRDGLNIFAFDILFLNGRDLTERPLAARRWILSNLFAHLAVPALHMTACFDDGPALYGAVEHFGLEGVVSKRKDRPYRSGPTSDWLKLKTPAWRKDHMQCWHLFDQRH